MTEFERFNQAFERFEKSFKALLETPPVPPSQPPSVQPSQLPTPPRQKTQSSVPELHQRSGYLSGSDVEFLKKEIEKTPYFQQVSPRPKQGW